MAHGHSAFTEKGFTVQTFPKSKSETPWAGHLGACLPVCLPSGDCPCTGPSEMEPEACLPEVTQEDTTLKAFKAPECSQPKRGRAESEQRFLRADSGLGALHTRAPEL